MKPSIEAIENFKKVIQDYQWTFDKYPEMIRMFA